MEKKLSEFDRLIVEMNKKDIFNKRVDKIINTLFKDEELIKANLYKNIIISYLQENIKEEALKNDTILTSIIKVYFDILVSRNTTIDKYLYLQSQSKTQENAISREIEKKYLDSKFVLVSASELFDISVDEYNDTDKIVDEIMMKYEDHCVRGRIYSNIFQKYKNDQEKSIAITKALVRLDKAYNTLLIIKASNNFEPYRESKKVR